MKIATTMPIITNRDQLMRNIAYFWDQISDGWRMVWGPHIHHGFYESDERTTPLIAQEKLIQKLADGLSIKPDAKILDVGCGLGGSSFYLAQYYQAHLTGITLSKQQLQMAEHHQQINHIKNVSFAIEDALSLQQFKNQSFDIVWSLESCEQFYDKGMFINAAHRVLKPNGRFMIATWCANQFEYQALLAKKYRKLCLAFDLPYMPPKDYYVTLLKNQGFTLDGVFDWSSHVKKSWDIGRRMVQVYSLWQIWRKSGWQGLKFVKQLRLMQDAFESGMLQYIVFYATKP